MNFTILIYFLFIILAYLIGSFLPGYFIAKLKGIDIFKKGYKLPGTSNVKKVLGLKYALLVGLYDFLKPILVFFIAFFLNYKFNLKINDWLILILPFFTIIGHIFPFYLKFKGGHGLASCIGFMFLLFSLLIYKKEINLFIFLIFFILSFIFLFIFKKIFSTQFGFMTAVYIYIIFTLIFFKPIPIFIILFIHLLLTFGNIIFFDFLEKVKRKKIKKHHLEHVWRKFLRPLAIIFPLGFLFFQKQTLILIIILTIFFFITEILKYAKIKKIQKILYRKKEKYKISSITYFFIGLILTLLLFEKNIATFSLFIIIFSDLIGYSVGIMYGKKEIIKGKSIVGSLSFLAFSIIIALAYYKFLNFNLIAGIVGCLIATILEIISNKIKINDNLLIPLGTSIACLITLKII